MHNYDDRTAGRRGSSPYADRSQNPEEMMQGIRSLTQLPRVEHRMHSTRNGGSLVNTPQAYDIVTWEDHGGEG
jgi:hypothetical protein